MPQGSILGFVVFSARLEINEEQYEIKLNITCLSEDSLKLCVFVDPDCESDCLCSS